MILGIDEVGRGPWAGPLVVGAVVLGDALIPGLTDSKKAPAGKRPALAEAIRHQALGYGLGWVYAEELDRIGLSAGLVLATRRAVEQVTAPYHEIIIDGTVNFLKDTTKGGFVTTMKKADLLVPSVSAASILAKVARDTYMAEQDVLYPGYHFGSHVGYGTAKHRAAIEAHGLTPLHRRSFAPIATYESRTTKTIGDEGEAWARRFLETQGFRILATQWRTKWCEIDIVAQDDTTLFFVEVKTRHSRSFGTAADAITPKKQRQMRFAAEMYLSHYPTDKAVRLAAVTIDGSTGRLWEIE